MSGTAGRRRDLYIGGEWLATAECRTVVHAWTGETTGRVAVAGRREARLAVDAAERALATPLPVPRRADVLARAARALLDRAEEFARLIVAEVGKPISAARAEVERAATTLTAAAEEAKRLPAEVVPLDAVPAGEGALAFTVPEPRGVVAAITPFNFPLNLVVHKLGPAIAAGCPVVFKPSDRAPLLAADLVEVFAEAGLPAGWLNLVTGAPEEVVAAWQEDDRVAIVNFTGSSRVGWAIKAASPRKLHILELGSNTAMVVDESADLARAAADAAGAAFANSGQACVSLQRVYVLESVAAEFLARLEDEVRRVPYGDPTDPATVVGPLVSDADAQRVVEWVAEAEAAGARIVVGGRRSGRIVEPTLVVDAPVTSRLVCEEVFGPVVTVRVVADLDAAVAEVNDSAYGLNTAIYTASLVAAIRYAKDASAGSVFSNTPPSFRADHMPYGGVKDSGQGREGVKYAIEEHTRQKLVVLRS